MCQAVIKIGAVQKGKPTEKPESFTTSFSFAWCIETNGFDMLESKDSLKLQPSRNVIDVPLIVPHGNSDVLVMDYNFTTSKTCLRDFNNYYEICLGYAPVGLRSSHNFIIQGYSSDSD